MFQFVVDRSSYFEVADFLKSRDPRSSVKELLYGHLPAVLVTIYDEQTIIEFKLVFSQVIQASVNLTTGLHSRKESP